MSKIVLLHGWGQQAPSKLEGLVSSLRAKEFEVFVPHMPGFGINEPPQEPWTVTDYAEWVLQEVAKVKGWDSFVLCGYSFGGRISIKLAVMHPEKVEKLILIASAGIKQQLSLRARILRTISNIGRSVFSLPGLHLFKSSLQTIWRKLLGRKDYYQVSGVMQKTFLNVIAEDLTTLLTAVTSKTLILWGKKDQFVPIADAHVMHDSIAQSQLKVFSQADHFLPYESPEEIADEIDIFIHPSNDK